MFRRFMVLGIGVIALIGVLAAPGQVHAQRGRGGAARGINPGMQARVNRRINPAMMQPRFNPNARRTFIPGFGFTPNFGFTPGFGFTPPGSNGGFFGPGFNRARFDRFEDRFENRFGRFDRFEDRFENRFGFSPFDPRFNRFGFSPFGVGFGSRFVPGFGFVPSFGLPAGLAFVPGLGLIPAF